MERTPDTMIADEKKWYAWASNPASFTLDKIGTFAFDTTPVKTQIAQMSAVSTQYQAPFELGVGDYDTGFSKMTPVSLR